MNEKKHIEVIDNKLKQNKAVDIHAISLRTYCIKQDETQYKAWYSNEKQVLRDSDSSFI